MDNEDKRIEHWKKLVARLEDERRVRGDQGLPSDLEMKHLLRQERVSANGRAKKCRAAWQQLKARSSDVLYRVVSGRARPRVDSELQQLLDVLLRSTGKLNAEEICQIHDQGIVRRGMDGKPEAVGPSRREFMLAVTGIALLILVPAPSLVYLLADPFRLPTHIGPAMLLGVSTGTCSRHIYKFYWGRERLARKLTYLWPAFRYVGDAR